MDAFLALYESRRRGRSSDSPDSDERRRKEPRLRSPSPASSEGSQEEGEESEGERAEEMPLVAESAAGEDERAGAEEAAERAWYARAAEPEARQPPWEVQVRRRKRGGSQREDYRAYYRAKGAGLLEEYFAAKAGKNGKGKGKDLGKGKG